MLAVVELHLPVMVNEVIDYLDCRKEGVFVDATTGDGGHAEAICQVLPPSGLLVGIDWDQEALDRAMVRLSAYKEQVVLVSDSYVNLEKVLESLGHRQVDGILIDLGASTLQLMDPKRGFSFHREGNLDMRMDRRQQKTAADIINRLTVDQLSEIFFRYGQERWSRRIAARIVREREQDGPFTDCKQLSETVKAAVPARYRRHGGHPARRTFQALRLAVNSELDNLAAVLPAAVRCLKSGGRLCIMSYHSLEDRLVKRYFREKSGHCSCPPDIPCSCLKQAELNILTYKAVRPTEAEVDINPRSRSARLRAAVRVQATI